MHRGGTLSTEDFNYKSNYFTLAFARIQLLLIRASDLNSLNLCMRYNCLKKEK